MSPDPIAAHLRALAERLPGSHRQTARMLAEVEAHLRDSAAALGQSGLTGPAAASEAVRRFGAADMVVDRLQREAPFPNEPHVLLRAATSIVIAAAGLIAAAMLVVVNLPPDVGWAWRIGVSAFALAVLGHGGLTLWLLWSQCRVDRSRAPVVSVGVVLAMAGAAAVVWPVHPGLAIGDWQEPGVLSAALIALQGALAVWACYPARRSPPHHDADMRREPATMRVVPASTNVTRTSKERSVTDWHIAQMNVGNLLYTQDDPRVAGFMSALDEINALADGSPGFVWRLQSDSGNATDIQVSDDPSFIVNMSVWTDVESLFAFVYKTAHRGVMAKRRQWFAPPTDAYQVLWWIEAGRLPTVEEGLERLAYLNEHGPSAHAFGFKQSFPPPDADGDPEDLRPEPYCVGWE